MTLSKRITIFALFVVLAATIAAAVLFSSVGNEAYASDVFDYVGTVKTVNGSVEGGKRGLRLFGYDNGVTANFKNAQTDVFSAELQIGSHDGKKDLKKYSLVFTDVKSGINAGCVTVLVMSGETTAEILESSEEQPDIILESGKDILDALCR